MPRDPSTNLLTELALALIQSLLKKVGYYERSPVCTIDASIQSWCNLEFCYIVKIIIRAKGYALWLTLPISVTAKHIY